VLDRAVLRLEPRSILVELFACPYRKSNPLAVD
jgi:hypothetical protein